MKIYIADLKLALAWLEQNSNDVTVQVGMDLSEIRVTASDRGSQICVIRIFDADGNSKAKITSSDNLETKVRIK